MSTLRGQGHTEASEQHPSAEFHQRHDSLHLAATLTLAAFTLTNFAAPDRLQPVPAGIDGAKGKSQLAYQCSQPRRRKLHLELASREVKPANAETNSAADGQARFSQRSKSSRVQLGSQLVSCHHRVRSDNLRISDDNWP